MTEHPLSPGKTGKFPDGRIDADDEGELAVGICTDEAGHVIINFGCSVSWIGMKPEDAIRFAVMILEHVQGHELGKDPRG